MQAARWRATKYTTGFKNFPDKPHRTLLFTVTTDIIAWTIGTCDHDAGEQTESTFRQSVARLIEGQRNRREVMQRGRKYIQWLRGHLLDEMGRLFPMIERGLDPETQSFALALPFPAD